MKMAIRFYTIVLLVILTGCANNTNEINTQNRNTIDTPNVKYDSPNHGGPAMTGVDVSDPKLDKDKYQNIKGFRKNLKKENVNIR